MTMTLFSLEISCEQIRGRIIKIKIIIIIKKILTKSKGDTYISYVSPKNNKENLDEIKR